jgi:dihydrofolate reductase
LYQFLKTRTLLPESDNERRTGVRKVVFFNLMSLDGYFEGPNREIDWHNVDEEFNEFAIDQVGSADILLFGRVTYELMASFWPTEEAMRDDPIVAKMMNTIPKIVFSRTLDRADWNNTRLVKGEAAEEIAKLKQQPGRDMFIFGSADLASTLVEPGLIDEYRVLLNPVVLGSGSPLFKGIKNRLTLKLASIKTFRNGNILLIYHPDEKRSGSQA